MKNLLAITNQKIDINKKICELVYSVLNHEKEMSFVTPIMERIFIGGQNSLEAGLLSTDNVNNKLIEFGYGYTIPF